MLRRISSSKNGSVSVETALMMSFVFVPMLLGLWDVAQIGSGQSKVHEALQDVLTYVAAGNASNGSGITAAAQSAYGTSIAYRQARSATAFKLAPAVPLRRPVSHAAAAAVAAMISNSS
jgi:hypothetical protein